MSNLSYNGQIIEQRNLDGYVNATQMCQANGKRINDWTTTKEAQAYLSYLSTDTGIPATELIKQIKPNVNKGIGGGTWIHPDLAICLGRWISVEFAVWCDRHIKKYLESGTVVQPHQILGAYQERVKEMFDQLPLIPKGYWCVLHESANILIWVETQLKCPVDKSDLLDGSIGKSWSNYRSDKSWALDRIKFPYTFPCGKKVEPWCYRMSELGYFRSFLQDDYCPNGLLAYLNRKYPGIVKV